MDPHRQTFIELSTANHIFRIDPDKIESLTRIICQGLSVESFELSWDFIDDDAMQTLNRDYREQDRSTDVLSFPQQEWAAPLTFTAPAWPLDTVEDELSNQRPPELLGDVVISPSVAMQNALSIGHELDREICFLLVHGILHLCGHDHLVPEEEERMTHEQQTIMKYLEHVAATPLWTQCVSSLEVVAK